MDESQLCEETRSTSFQIDDADRETACRQPLSYSHNEMPLEALSRPSTYEDNTFETATPGHDLLDLSKPRRTQYWPRLLEALSYVLPDFLRPGGLLRDRHLSSTSYLDALRGYAACIVVMYHTHSLQHVWKFHELPVISVLWAGDGMVLVFFVISGYVLTFRMLQHIRNKDAPRLLQGAASSTFRRYLRLFLPTGVATLFYMLFVALGLTHNRKPKPTFLAQLADWLKDFVHQANPFADIKGHWYNHGFGSRYAYQLWTIPVEFLGSVVVFFYCIAVCKLSTKARMWLTWICILAAYYWQAVWIACFLAGLFLADLALARQAQKGLQIGIVVPIKRRQQSPAARIGWALVLLLGVFLLSQPKYMTKKSPFRGTCSTNILSQHGGGTSTVA